MERFLLAAVSTEQDTKKAWRSLEELKELLETAGGVAEDSFVQNLSAPNPATYVGSGKAKELKALIDAYEADGIICDDELSPVQLKNLSEMLDCKVIDRTMLILDIFASHALTKEGKIQVELAQLKYRLSHLRGIGKAMSRLGGGIGTRGPGETKLETDKRSINRRIAKLNRDIKELEQSRSMSRKSRISGVRRTAAIVGYTNAGKSTILNRLTDADVLAEDKLFATLDPTTRVCVLPGGEEIFLTDTVGFIHKLPHQLIDAFRSTLEEAKYADILIHVVDSTGEDVDLHMKTVYGTLDELGISGKPVITVFNKCDLPGSDSALRDGRAELSLRISAKTGDGIERLYDAVDKVLREQRIYLERTFSYCDAAKAGLVRKYGQLISEEYREDGIYICAYVPKELGGKL